MQSALILRWKNVRAVWPIVDGSIVESLLEDEEGKSDKKGLP